MAPSALLPNSGCNHLNANPAQATLLSEKNGGASKSAFNISEIGDIGVSKWIDGEATGTWIAQHTKGQRNEVER
jgi:hypothetical protein